MSRRFNSSTLWICLYTTLHGSPLLLQPFTGNAFISFGAVLFWIMQVFDWNLIYAAKPHRRRPWEISPEFPALQHNEITACIADLFNSFCGIFFNSQCICLPYHCTTVISFYLHHTEKVHIKSTHIKWFTTHTLGALPPLVEDDPFRTKMTPSAFWQIEHWLSSILPPHTHRHRRLRILHPRARLSPHCFRPGDSPVVNDYHRHQSWKHGEAMPSLWQRNVHRAVIDSQCFMQTPKHWGGGIKTAGGSTPERRKREVELS